MELKRLTRDGRERDTTLLIVPYGIETSLPRLTSVVGNMLLIVPYGIETHFQAIARISVSNF